MKLFVFKCSAIVGLIVFNHVQGFSQTTSTTSFAIVSRDLQLTYTKTTNLLFPYPVVSVDRGSAEVLVQKAKSIDNVLQVKAGRENITETNLSVFTEDGTLYSFRVSYDACPQQLNYVFEKQPGAQNKKEMIGVQQTAQEVASLTSESTIRQQRKYQMQLQLQYISVRENVLYFPLLVCNHSNINYAVQSLRFFVRDKRAGKRTALQQLPLQALYIYHPLKRIEGNDEARTVVALPGFTLPQGKQLWIELTEQNGGRNLRLLVNNRRLLQAKQLDLP